MNIQNTPNIQKEYYSNGQLYREVNYEHGIQKVYDNGKLENWKYFDNGKDITEKWLKDKWQEILS